MVSPNSIGLSESARVWMRRNILESLNFPRGHGDGTLSRNAVRGSNSRGGSTGKSMLLLRIPCLVELCKGFRRWPGRPRGAPGGLTPCCEGLLVVAHGCPAGARCRAVGQSSGADSVMFRLLGFPAFTVPRDVRDRIAFRGGGLPPGRRNGAGTRPRTCPRGAGPRGRRAG